jgi:hypothetical protein
MKRLCFLLLILLSTSMMMMAQQDEEDEPIPPPHKAGGPKFGGAAGFTQNLLFLDMTPINQILAANNCAPFDGDGLFMMGGQGYGYIMFLPNVRVGGMGGSGTRISTSIQGNVRRQVELSAGFGGVTIDYVFSVLPRLDISTGALLGGGGMSFTLRRDDGTVKLWNDVWSGFGGGNPASNYSTKISGSFFVIQPNVNVEVALLRWLGLRVGAGYTGMIGNNWKLDDTYDLYNAPDNISAKGWMINGGVFLGTFLY